MGLRIVKCASVALADLLKGSESGYRSNLPADLQVVGVLQSSMDQVCNTVSVVCRSAEWDEPMEGAAIPDVDAWFTVNPSPSVAAKETTMTHEIIVETTDTVKL